MRELLSTLVSWRIDQLEAALATVVKTWGSSPRAPGSKMLINTRGEMAGSVSGGCVEGAVVQEALRILPQAAPTLLHFGVADETAWEVGLACGGEIDVLVQAFPATNDPWGDELIDILHQAIDAQEPVGLVSLIEAPQKLLGLKHIGLETGQVHSQLPARLRASLQPLLAQLFRQRAPFLASLSYEDQPLRLFLDIELPAPTLILVGGVHIASALVPLAKALQYRVVVVEPRAAFADAARFPAADEVIQAWPDEGLRQAGLTSSTAVAVLSHDAKIDDPALREALTSRAFYIGALGSRKTQAARRTRLREAGLAPQAVARLRGPIGLALGGRHPSELALSILAEIVAVQHGSSLVESAR